MSATPSPADTAKAETFVTEAFADTCPVWLANNRAKLVRQAAFAEMQDRQNAEFKARFAKPSELERSAIYVGLIFEGVGKRGAL